MAQVISGRIEWDTYTGIIHIISEEPSLEMDRYTTLGEMYFVGLTPDEMASNLEQQITYEIFELKGIFGSHSFAASELSYLSYAPTVQFKES